MKIHFRLVIAFLLGLYFILIPTPKQEAKAESTVVGGIAIHSVLPKKICVGDTITISGSASITNLEEDTSLAWLPVTRVAAKPEIGNVNPENILQYNDGYYFNITYKAISPGQETITFTVNETIASTQVKFDVEETCDYDAFLTTVLHLSVDLGDEIFKTITTVTGSGTMVRARDGSDLLAGEGTWNLVENVISKPPMCLEYYSPPLILDGPFKLNGKLSDEGDTVDVILSFLPKQGQSTYHGETICIDENGDIGYGSGIANGSDPSMASKIDVTFLTGGGTQSVELEGEGLKIVQSMSDLIYTSTLTLIPR